MIEWPESDSQIAEYLETTAQNIWRKNSHVSRGRASLLIEAARRLRQLTESKEGDA